MVSDDESAEWVDGCGRAFVFEYGVLLFVERGRGGDDMYSVLSRRGVAEETQVAWAGSDIWPAEDTEYRSGQLGLHQG